MKRNKRKSASQQSQSRRKKNRGGGKGKIIGIVLGVIVIVVGLFAVIFFQSHFLPGTKASGVNIAFLNAKAAKNKVDSTNKTQEITLKSPDQSLTLVLPEKYTVPLSFLEKNINKRKITLPENEDFEAKLRENFDALALPDGTPSQDAHIAYTDLQFSVVPEVYGTGIDKEKLFTTILNDVKDAKNIDTYQLDDFYSKPAVLQDDPALQGRLVGLEARLNKQVNLNINGQNYTMTREDIGNVLNENGDVDNQKITDWMNSVNSQYASTLQPVTFTNIHGVTKTYTNNGYYGWKIDVAGAVDTITSAIQSANAVENVEVPISGKTQQNATVSGTYVEVDLDAQKMYMYVDGNLTVDTPVVTGKFDKRTATLPGFHTILTMASDTFLSGENLTGTSYKVPVKYWMPLISRGGVVSEIGIHDADYNSANFGNPTAYQTSAGSLGCINTPSAAAGKVFANAYIGMPVIIYGSIYDNAPNNFKYPVEYGS